MLPFVISGILMKPLQLKGTENYNLSLYVTLSLIPNYFCN